MLYTMAKESFQVRKGIFISCNYLLALKCGCLMSSNFRRLESSCKPLPTICGSCATRMKGTATKSHSGFAGCFGWPMQGADVRLACHPLASLLALHEASKRCDRQGSQLGCGPHPMLSAVPASHCSLIASLLALHEAS